MAPFAVSRLVEHPYHATSDAFAHYRPTSLTLPAFSAGCVPFRWMLRGEATEIAEQRDIALHDEAEQEAREVMKFDSAWVQNVDNQRRMLDTFFSSVQPESSLAFFYAKEVAFVEDPRRVLIGVGRVTSIGPALEYDYAQAGPSRSMIWERAVGHSIRPDGSGEGFLLPYHDAIAHAAEDPTFDPADLAVFAPDEAFHQFSYGSEHVSHDAAIGTLLNLIDGLERAEQALGVPRAAELRWAGERLGELWTMRGPYPGLGSALHAFGVDHADLFAYRIKSLVADNEDPWPMVEQATQRPAPACARGKPSPGSADPAAKKSGNACPVRGPQGPAAA